MRYVILSSLYVKKSKGELKNSNFIKKVENSYMQIIESRI